MVATSIRAIQVGQHSDASVLKTSTVPLVAVTGVNDINIIESKTSPPGCPCENRFFHPWPLGIWCDVEVGSETQHGFEAGDRVAILGNNTCAEYVAVYTINLANLPDNVSLEHLN